MFCKGRLREDSDRWVGSKVCEAREEFCKSKVGEDSGRLESEVQKARQVFVKVG